MRLAAIEMLDEAMSCGLLGQRWDCLFTTSLLGVTDLRSLLPPSLRSTPLILYLHENQAAYPQGPSMLDLAKRDFQFALTNLTSILAADFVIWNSAWNRDSFIQGIDEILRHSPDTPLRQTVAQRVRDRSEVIWPPVEPPPERHTRSARKADEPIRVLWPHRWEHDKGPDELLAVAERETERLNLRWTILGERFREVPRALVEFERLFSDHIDHFGYVHSREAYWAALHRCDWVLSTANHEFFGIAVVEALFAGCLPWLPQRLSYPELLPKQAHGLNPQSKGYSPDMLRRAIRTHLVAAGASKATSDIDRALSRECGVCL